FPASQERFGWRRVRAPLAGRIIGHEPSYHLGLFWWISLPVRNLRLRAARRNCPSGARDSGEIRKGQRDQRVQHVRTEDLVTTALLKDSVSDVVTEIEARMTDDPE